MPPPSPTAQPTLDGLPTTISLAALVDRVRNIGIDDQEYLAAYGPRGLFRFGHNVYRADLSFATSREIFRVPQRSLLGAWAVGGKYAVLVEGTYEHHPRRVPCEWAGALTWTMWLIDLDPLITRPRAMHEGVQQRDLGCGAAWPVVAVEGNRVAWAREAGDPEGTAWRVTIESVDGDIERSLDAGSQVVDLELSSGGVAWIQGQTDLHGQLLEGSLMFAPAGAGQASPLGGVAFGVDLADDRIVWTEFRPGTDCLCPQDIWSTTFTDPVPRAVGTTATTLGEISAYGDVLADVGAGIQLRKFSTGARYLVLPTDGAEDVSLHGGWLTWSEFVGDPEAGFFYGIRVESLPLD